MDEEDWCGNGYVEAAVDAEELAVSLMEEAAVAAEEDCEDAGVVGLLPPSVLPPEVAAVLAIGDVLSVVDTGSLVLFSSLLSSSLLSSSLLSSSLHCSSPD